MCVYNKRLHMHSFNKDISHVLWCEFCVIVTQESFTPHFCGYFAACNIVHSVWYWILGVWYTHLQISLEKTGDDYIELSPTSFMQPRSSFPFPLRVFCLIQTLPMLKNLKRFLNSSKPCHVGSHWIALAEYSQMSTHMPGFQSFSVFFCIILYWPN